MGLQSKVYKSDYGALAFYRYPNTTNIINPWRLRAASIKHKYFDVAQFSSKKALIDHLELIIKELNKIPAEPIDDKTEYGLVLTTG